MRPLPQAPRPLARQSQPDPVPAQPPCHRHLAPPRRRPWALAALLAGAPALALAPPDTVVGLIPGGRQIRARELAPVPTLYREVRDFSNAIFEHDADLEGACFQQALLVDADLAYTNCARANFALTDLTRTRLQDARLDGADLRLATIRAEDVGAPWFLRVDLRHTWRGAPGKADPDGDAAMAPEPGSGPDRPRAAPRPPSSAG